MQRKEADRLDTRVKVALLVTSLATIVALAAAALRENVFADWHRIRKQYQHLLESKAEDDLGRAAAAVFEVHIEQNFVPELGVVDRCITCHAGVEDPRMVDVAQPFTTHPGRYLEDHDPAKFGCSVCHRGQGRATGVADAHGRVPHWEHPLLERRLVVSSCTKCHTENDLFGPAGLIAESAETVGEAPVSDFERGRRLATRYGCFGCHTLDGKGGSLGPDLTDVGAKTAHDFDFSHLPSDTARDTSQWLREHFLRPSVVSPGSVMPPVSDPDDVRDLTSYMLSLQPPQPLVYGGKGDRRAQEQDGAGLYARYCSACHGERGRGGRIAAISTPSLSNPDTLAVASDEYLRFIVSRGRSGTAMQAWGPGHGNLSAAEIDAIVSYIRGWEPAEPDLADIRSERGDPSRGAAYYKGLCAGCHGARGEGGVGNALRPPSFLAIADDRFLAESIVRGRDGTAMPSWKHLSAEAISDILAFVRSWQAPAASFEQVAAAARVVPAAVNRRYGQALYARNCRACHGRDGAGGIGPSLTSPEFLELVDDRYLYAAITRGRPTTAMPAWRHLSAEDLGALIAYLRSFQSEASPVEITRLLERVSVPSGDAEVGAVYYAAGCAGCHGEAGRGGTGPQLANPEFLDSVTDAALFRWIGYGRTGTAMKGFLPSAQGVLRLTRQNIADIIAYLRDLRARRAPRGVTRGRGNPALGAEIYASTCASCHGEHGEGASGPQLANPAFLATASNGFLTATIVLGRDGTPMTSMVHGEEGIGQVDPKNVDDLVAFLREWEGQGGPRRPRRIVEMTPRALRSGEAAYRSYCSGCHGPDGRGTSGGSGHFAPALNNREFLEAATDGFLLATIARGRMGTPMRPFGAGAGGIVSLGYDQIFDIVSYIRSWQHPTEGDSGGNSHEQM